MPIKIGEYVQAESIHGDVVEGVVHEVDVPIKTITVLGDGHKSRFVGFTCLTTSAQVIPPDQLDKVQRKHYDWCNSPKK